MSAILKNRVEETTISTGAGPVELLGAPGTGEFQTLIVAIGDGNQCDYCIEDTVNGDFEVGRGTVNLGSPDTFTRNVIFESSNGGNAVVFGAGTKKIFVTNPAQTSTVTGKAHTGLPNAEFSDVEFNLDRVVAFTGGGADIAQQRAHVVKAPTYSAPLAQTITEAATVHISGAPIAAGSLAITNSYALLVTGPTKLDGKLTVTGLIDPTGLQLTPVAANPGDANTFWVDSAGNVPTFGAAAVAISGAIDAGDITSGTFADALVAESNVTQHEAALTILESQITDGIILARVGSVEIVTAIWAFNGGTSGASAPFTVDSTFLVSNLNADLLDGNSAIAFAAAVHTHAAGDIVSGTFTDARVAASNVTQHVASIDHDALLNFVAAEHTPLNDAIETAGNVWSASKIATEIAAGGGGINNVVEDTTPALGGDLDANTFAILFDNNTGIKTENGGLALGFVNVTSPINSISIRPGQTTGNAQIEAVGETNTGISFAAKGTGFIDMNSKGSCVSWDFSAETSNPGTGNTIWFDDNAGRMKIDTETIAFLSDIV